MIASRIPYSATLSGSAAIPDNNPVGVGFALSFSDSSASQITGMSVSFTINGGWNGDLYAYLSHGSGQVVLLNRTGRTAGNPDGSDTSGFTSFTLGSAFSPDVHLAVGTTGQALTGSYAPDGRNVLPGQSLDTTPRDATFSVFDPANPNGAWTLFFADMVAGGPAGTLEGFSVSITAVPEPVTWALLIFGAVFGAVQLARFGRRRRAAG